MVWTGISSYLGQNYKKEGIFTWKLLFKKTSDVRVGFGVEI